MSEGLVLFGHGLIVAGLVDVAEVMHATKHIGTTQQGARHVVDRIAGGRKFRQRCQHRALGLGQLVQGLAVIELGGSGNAVGAIAEETLVEVKLEDLVLAQRILDAEGEEDLGQLARIGDFRAQEELPGHLLGDRAATGHMLAAGRCDQPHRTQDAGDIDAGMTVEIRVFRRQHRIFEAIRHIAHVDGDAPCFAECGHQLAIRREYLQRYLQLHIAQRFGRRQARGDQPVGNAEAETTEHGSAESEVQRVAGESKQKASGRCDL